MDGQKPRKSFARRLVRTFLVLMLATAGVVGALPWLLSTPPGRSAIVAAVNRRIAPSTLVLRGLSLSWTGPIRLSGISFVDTHGKTLLKARSAVLDRGLFALARNRSRLGTLTVEGASADIERRLDGAIDLLDALLPPPAAVAAPGVAIPPVVTARGSERGTDLTLRVVRGALTLRTPELADPFTAERVDMDMYLPGMPGRPLVCRVRMARPAAGTDQETLGIDGTLDLRAPGLPDLSVTLKAERWPIGLATGGGVVRGRLDGLLKVDRQSTLWTSSGALKMLGLDASGPFLGSDRLALDVVGGTWDVAETAGVWAVRKLNLTSPVGSLSASGAIVAGAGAMAPDGRVEGRVDLAALAKQIPQTLRLRDGLSLDHGMAQFVLQSRAEGDARKTTIEASISDLIASERTTGRTITLRETAVVNVRARQDATGLALEAFTVKTPFLEVTGAGDLQKAIRLSGTIDLGKVEESFHDLLDLGQLQFAGKGRMAGEYALKTKGTFLGRYAAEFRGLKVAGLTSEPIERETLRFDAAASGTVAPSGLPAAYEAVKVNLKSSQDSVAIATQMKAGVTSLTGTASLPITLSGRAGQADAKLVGRLKPRKDPSLGQGVIEIDEVRLAVKPTDPKLVAAGTLAFAARGWFDLDGDDIALTPLPVPSPIVLSPEGLKFHGLRKSPMAAQGGRAVLIGDLAAIERALWVWNGREPSGLGGAISAQLGMDPVGTTGKTYFGVNVSIPDFSRPGPDGNGRKPEGPLIVAYGGKYDASADQLSVDILLGISRYGRLDAAGKVDDLATRRVLGLEGTITPAWEIITALAAETIEPKAQIQGKARPFHIKGPITGGTLATLVKGLDAELGLELTSATLFGLTLGPAPIVIRCQAGALSVDPIQTTLGNGRVDLKPGLSIDDEKGIAVLLAKGSRIDGVEVTDSVSNDLLTFIAPVLENATNVHGKISLAVDAGDFPITGPPTRTATMTGQLDFQDVEFAPGPFAHQVLGLVNRPKQAGVRLQEPVQLSIRGGRVYQKGLYLPISKDATIGLEGSIGFDQTLDLRAVVPITKSMLGPAAGLDGLVSKNKITVPISGTVSHPQVNKQALQVALRELSKKVLKGDLSRTANQLLDRLGPPPDARGGGNPPASSDTLRLDLKGLENQLRQRLAPPGGQKP